MMRVLLRPLFAALAYMYAGAAAAAPPAGMVPVVCGVDRPIVAGNQNVGAEAFSGQKERAPFSYRWRASGGAIHPGQVDWPAAGGNAITWSANGAAPGLYRIAVEVSGVSGKIGTCTLLVTVTGARRSASGEGGLPVRDLLPHGRHETGHYGIYSYILFGARPGGDKYDQFLSILQAYFQSFEDMRLQSDIPSEQLNVNYVFVAKPPKDGVDAGWVLDNYDYARAEAIIFGLRGPPGGCLHGHDGDGPFLVSALHPLGSAGETNMLCQDLSTVPASAMGFWIRQYAHQMDQQRVLDGKTIENLPLTLRTMVAVVANGMPMAVKAVRIWFNTGTAS